MNIKKTVLYLSIFLSITVNAQWKGEIPENFVDAERWEKLLDKLIDNKMYYSAMAASQRILTLFTELSIKEKAYKSIITITDEGYPFQVRNLYISGDIDPKMGFNIINNYNFYKGYVNEKKGLHKWAEHYFSKVDKERFHKYLFYQAINLYQENKLYDSLQILKKILRLDLGVEHTAFIKKTARTMARIYFELGDFQVALDIYMNFLLKTNPIKDTDWLETAWTLYHLKYYNRALGMLYNLESKTFSEVVYLEKFILRALIYRELCQTELMNGLADSFMKKFGYIVDGLKVGKDINSFDGISGLLSEQNKDYFQYSYLYKKLSEEETQIKRKMEENLDFSIDSELFDYLISTEKNFLQENAKMFEEASKRETVKYLVLLYENLRFLKYDVVLEKFNPNTVFMEKEEANLNPEKDKKGVFSFYWPQQKGIFWSDERKFYKTWLNDQCRSE
ncbi:hypothetical protein JXR93_03025 [bacterium]|nr:hypothetical protein [bacterium]